MYCLCLTILRPADIIPALVARHNTLVVAEVIRMWKRLIHVLRLMGIATGIIALLASTSCHFPTAEQRTSSTDAEPSIQTSAEPTVPVPSPMPTSQPLQLFVDPLHPQAVFTPETNANLSLTSDPEADLWFGLSAEKPAGVTLASAIWVYALTAPFPTLLDSIDQADLQAYWQSRAEVDPFPAARLYLPQSVAAYWRTLWGETVNPSIYIVTETPSPEELWEENAWAVLPFDALIPQLKVIAIDGNSPLFKTYDASADSLLSLHYELVLRDSSADKTDPQVLQLLSSMVTPTNRDTEKMTTLVMTGVTALVRATAYKMEMHGVTYPGEAIADWLTEADLTHISNEVSFYEDCPFPDPNSRLLFFCSNPDYIELFDYIGADIIELTGNHNNDSAYVYGVDVVPFSIDLYQERGMLYFGGGLNLSDALAPALLEHHGNRLAFIGCNASGPDYAWATAEHGGSAPCGDYVWMANEVSRLKREGYLPIATFQYYEDYYNFAGEHHVRDFGIMADAGAVIVNGSQAHRPKGMTFQNGAFVHYGLGNLFFDQMGIIDAYGNQILQTRWEFIQRHTLYDGRYLSTELLTAMLEDYAQPRPMTAQERSIFLTEIFLASGWNPR